VQKVPHVHRSKGE